MKTVFLNIVMPILCLLASGFSAAADFESTGHTKLAKINLMATETGAAWICSKGKKLSLKKDVEGYALIPAGSRLTFGKDYSAPTGTGSQSCSVKLSFVPEEGASYYANLEVGYLCKLNVYREGAKNRVGVDFEKSVGAPEVCR